MNGLIYVAECKVNGKRYVGQTVQKFEARQAHHKWKTENNIENTHFYNAIRKYGWDNFTWAVIVEGVDNMDSLNELEKYWIAELNTYNNGYNSTTGGDNYKRSEETKRKMSKAMTGKILSEEHKQKLREAHQGKKLSEEHKQKLRKASTGRTHSEEARKRIRKANEIPIISMDLGTECVEVFNSAKEAGRITGIERRNICACCRGKRKTAGGFKFSYM